MPSYAIKSSGIRQVAANTLIGNSTGSTGSAEELSATDAKTLLGLAATDSPTFGGLEFPASAIINAASGGLFFRSNGSNIFGYTGGQFTAYKSINPADTSRDLGSIAAGKSWRTLAVGSLASSTHVIEQRYGTNAQSFRIYNTDDGSQTNYERASIGWDSNEFKIQSQKGGTGSNRRIRIGSGSYGSITVNDYLDNTGVAFYQGGFGKFSVRPSNLEPVADNNYGLGTSSRRWSSLYAASSYLDNIYNSSGAGRIQLGGSDTIFYQAIRMQGAADYLGFDQGGKLYGDGAGTTISQRNGTNAQTFRIYNTDDGSQTNYERGIFDWSTTSNVLTIGTEAAGTGTQRSVKVTGGGYTVIQGASGSELHQGGSRVLRCSGAAYFYKSAEPIGTINLGGSSSRWANVYATNADLSEALTLTSHTPSTTINKLYNVGGTLYFNGSAAGGNPFDQNLNTSDAPTFAGQIIKGTAYIQSTGGATRWALQGNANLITQNSTGGPSMGGTVPYSFVGDTSTGIDSDGSGTLLLIPDTNVVEQRNGTNAQNLNVYNTYTDASNYQRLKIGWSSSVGIIGTENAGTSIATGLKFQIAGATKLVIGGVWIDLISCRPDTNGTRWFGDSTKRWALGYWGGNTVTTSKPIFDGTQTWNDAGVQFTGILANITNTASAANSKLIDLQVGGTTEFSVDKEGDMVIGNMTISTSGGTQQTITAVGDHLVLAADNANNRLLLHKDKGELQTTFGGFDVTFAAEADNVWSQRNGTNAQTFNIYNTYTDASNYERSVFKYVSGDLWIDTEYAGTGSPNRNIYIGKNGSAEFLFGNGKNTTYQNFVPSATGSWRVGGTSERFFAGYWGGNTVTTSTPMLDLSQTWNDGAIEFTGILSNITNAASASTSKLIDLQVGGTTKFKVDNDGSAYVGYGTKVASSNNGRIDFSASGVALFGLSNGGATLPTNGYFAFGSNYLNPSRARIYSDADNQIDIRYSTNAQTLNIYNTGSGSDYERGTLGWDSNVFTIGTQAAGTGTVRDLVLATGGTETIKVAGSNQRVTISADRTAIGSGSSHAGVLNLGGDRVLTFHGGNSSIRCPSGQLDFRTATSVFTLVGNAIRFQGYDGGGFLNIRNYSTGGSGTVVIRKLASQTSDLLKVLDDSGNNLFSLQHTGDFALGLNSTTNPDIYSYGLFTDNSNYERLKIEAGTAYNIRVQAAGTGTGRDLNIHSGASAALRLGVDGTNYIIMTSSGVKPAQDLFPNANNSYKNGTTSNRWSETNTVNLNSTGDINFSGLPTSSSGLSTGDLYLQSSGVPGGDYQIMVKT